MIRADASKFETTLQLSPDEVKRYMLSSSPKEREVLERSLRDRGALKVGDEVRRMLALSPQDVHIESPIEGYLRGYQPQNEIFLAEKAMPVIPVLKQTNLVWKLSPTVSFDTPASDIGSDEAGMPMIDIAPPSTITYTCKPFGLKARSFDSVAANMDAPLSAQILVWKPAYRQFLIRREIATANKVMDSANYGSNTSSPSTKWNNGGTPITDIRTALATLPIRPNRGFFSLDTWIAIQNNAEVKGFILSRASTGSGAVPLTVQRQLVAELLELEEIFVSNMRYNTAKPGQSVTNATLSPVWGSEKAAFIYSVDNPGIGDNGWGFTFRLGGAVKTRSYREEGAGTEGATIVQPYTYDDVKVLDTEGFCGYLFTNTLA